jgi:hypothetical protein
MRSAEVVRLITGRLIKRRYRQPEGRGVAHFEEDLQFRQGTEYKNGVTTFFHSPNEFMDLLESRRVQPRLFIAEDIGDVQDNLTYAIVNRRGVHKLEMGIPGGVFASSEANRVDEEIRHIAADIELPIASGVVEVNDMGFIDRMYDDKEDLGRQITAWTADVSRASDFEKKRGSEDFGKVSYIARGGKTLFLYQIRNNNFMMATPPEVTPEILNQFLINQFPEQAILEIAERIEVPGDVTESILSAFREGLI